tara:strand:- start:11 stop:1420 length:1410 start_codon:yes stop_codon:yes gene_type:complete
MPLILGTNSIKDTGYDVANSVRFNSGDSPYLNKTLSSSGNPKKFTISFWQKLGTSFDADRAVISGGADSNNYLVVRNSSSQTIQILETVSGSDHTNLVTNRVFRDVSAWYHIVVAIDTTQGTDTNRVKLYVNGTQETSFSTATYPGQNDDLQFNNNTAHAIGRRQPQGNIYMNGYLAEFVFIDDQQLGPTSFGEFDEDSPTIWKPKDVSGLTFGTNGFYLDFEDSGTLGNDAAGSNNFTSNNLAATDQSTDTCTNNFCTLNSLDTLYNGGTFSEGNLKVVTADSIYGAVTSTIGINSGKWYAEFKATDAGRDFAMVGIKSTPATGNGDGVGANDGYSYYSNGGKKVHGGSETSYGNSYDDGDIIGVAVDLDNNKIYFSKNGTFQNSGDPTTGSTGTGSAFDLDAPPSGFYFFSVSHEDNADGGTWEANFGSPPYSISSGNSDANGYGNFEYSVPSGFYAINSKNLAEFG